MNTDCIVYTMIDEALIETICGQLQIAFIPLFVSRSLRDYNGQIVSKSIIHVIYLTFKVNEHAEQICFMLIVSLNNHRIIIDKSWMNRHKVILNMLYNRIVFKSNRCKHLGAIFNYVSLKNNQNFVSSRRLSTWTSETFVTFVITETLKYIILKKWSVFNQIIKGSVVDSRSISALLEASTNFVELNSFESCSDLAQACRVEFVSNQNQTSHRLTIRAESRQLITRLNIVPMFVAVFYRLSNRVHHCQNVQCFFLIIFIIIEKLARRAKIKTACSEFNALTELTMN